MRDGLAFSVSQTMTDWALGPAQMAVMARDVPLSGFWATSLALAALRLPPGQPTKRYPVHRFRTIFWMSARKSGLRPIPHWELLPGWPEFHLEEACRALSMEASFSTIILGDREVQ